MKKLFLIVTVLFTLTFAQTFSDEDIDALVKKFPSVLVTFSSLNTPVVNKKITWSRTELIENFSINQLSVKENKIFLNNDTLVFQSPEQSKLEYVVDKAKAFTQVIYKWEFEIDLEGKYFVVVPIWPGTFGFLNNEPIIILNNGIISKRNSGDQLIQLNKGNNILFISTVARAPNQLSFLPESDADRVKNEISKKLFSNTKDDFIWATTIFMTYLSNLQNGIYPQFNNLLSKLNKMHPFEKKTEMVTLMSSYLSQTNLDGYMIEKHMYLNFSDLYFFFSKNSDTKILPLNGFFKTNRQQPRTLFLGQLIFDGQKELADQYFNKTIEAFNNSALTLEDKEKFISAFYLERFLNLYRIGRIREANEILKVTTETCKKEKLDWFANNKISQEDAITLTQSFDETAAYQNKEAIEGYDGSNDQLSNLYKIFTGLSSNLVKRNDGAISMFYSFLVNVKANEKLNIEFEKYCSEKIKVKIEKANPIVDTVCDIWRTAEFHEREAYDLLGVEFVGHPDLRRLFLTPDHEGFPLRKDYEDPINMIKL